MDLQPDLFGESEAREAEAARWRQPATCPCCGTQEPSGWMLRNNHGITPGEEAVGGFPSGQHPIYGRQCVAQVLVANHIYYDVTNGRDEELERDINRGRALGLDVESIIGKAEAAKAADRAAEADHQQRDEAITQIRKSRDAAFPQQGATTAHQQGLAGQAAIQDEAVKQPGGTIPLVAASPITEPTQDAFLDL